MRTSTTRSTERTSVNLKQLPDQGEQFQFNQGSGELNRHLVDLIGSHAYNIDVTIRPQGNVYEITGRIDTEMDRICSHCGRDTHLPIHDEFSELIVVMTERPRAGHSGHTGSLLEGPSCNYITGHEFDLAEFVHEHIALAEPPHPQCGRSDCDEIFKLANRGIKIPIDFNPLLRDNGSSKKES